MLSLPEAEDPIIEGVGYVDIARGRIKVQKVRLVELSLQRIVGNQLVAIFTRTHQDAELPGRG